MKKVVLLLVTAVAITTISGCSVKKTEKVTDAEKFSDEYSVSKDNPFKYIDIDQVLDIIENKSGIIFFGNPDCEWCSATATILTEALKYKNVDNAYYYNPKSIKEKDTKEYKKLIDLLKDYLPKNENDEADPYLPDVYFIKNGKVIGHNNDTATMEGSLDEALSDKTKKELKSKYLDLISEYNIKECTDSSC